MKMKQKNQTKQVGKKGDVLQDGVFFLIFIILIMASLYGSAYAASKAGFKLGDHQSTIFSMISDGDKISYYFDEAGRQALLTAINEVSNKPGTTDCGEYQGYPLLNLQADKIQNIQPKNCMIDKQARIAEIAKQTFREYAKNQIKQDFTIRLVDGGALTILTGSASNPETITSSTGSYTIKPSFESAINYNLTYLKILDDAVLEMTQCKDASCLQKIAAEKSTQDFAIKLGNCEDWKTIIYADEQKATHEYSGLEQLREDILDCIASADDDCTCEIRTRKQDYNVALDNDGSNLKLTAYKAGSSSISPLESTTLEGAQLAQSSFNIIFDGNPKQITKKDDKVSLPDVSEQKKQCSLDKTQYRLCAMTGKEYYVYNDAKQNIEKKKLAYKFAIEIPSQIQETQKIQLE